MKRCIRSSDSSYVTSMDKIYDYVYFGKDPTFIYSMSEDGSHMRNELVDVEDMIRRMDDVDTEPMNPDSVDDFLDEYDRVYEYYIKLVQRYKKKANEFIDAIVNSDGFQKKYPGASWGMGLED